MSSTENETILDVFLTASREHADKTAFTCMEQTLTFADIERLSGQFASYLQNHTNLNAGDRVAVQLPNILQYPVVVFGILRAGMVLVNTNPLYTAREVKHQLNDSGAKALVVLSNIADTASKVIAETKVEQVIVTNIGDMHGTVKRLLINNVAKYVKKLVPEFSFANSTSLLKALSLGASGQLTPVVRQLDDVAVLQYTGGTTGVAKGAMLTQGNIVSNMRQVEASMGYDGDKAEIFIAPLPLYHVYAFTLHCMMIYSVGGHNVLIPNPRDLPSFVKAMAPHKFTGFCGLNTLFNGLCHNEEFKRLDFSSLETTASGGMALTSDVADLWKSVTGCTVSEGFGMTETSPVVSMNTPDDIRIGTVGRPVANTEVRVIDEEGNVLPADTAGELMVRGPQVMKGYWQRPEATAEVLSEDGWLNTGDMAVIQNDGFIRIVDRKKDMIIVSGFNVYPNEIEAEVCKHPMVLEAAAIGVEDAKSGEAVKLFVVKSDPALTDADLKSFCRENLTAYKIPRVIVFRDDLPKSNVGKILRRELKEEEAAMTA